MTLRQTLAVCALASFCALVFGQPRQRVFSALASYGDPDAIQYIQPHTESGYFRMANSAKSAVRRLERAQERKDGAG